MLKKDKNENKQDIERNINRLANKVEENKKRVEEERLNIYRKLEILEKEFNNPKEINFDRVNQFNLDDLMKDIESKETREDIRFKFQCLKKASELDAYNDRELFGLIKEYLEEIRPEIERLDETQWKLLDEKNRVEQEYNRKLNEILQQYQETNSQISKLLKVADIGYPRVGYNKQLFVPGDPTWQANPSNAVDLVDIFLKEDAAGYSFYKNSGRWR